MEMTTVALIKLACLLNGQQDQVAVQDFLTQLKPEQVQQILHVQESGMCAKGIPNVQEGVTPAARSMPTEDF